MRVPGVLLASLLAVISAHGRTWTSTSGTTIEAEYVGTRYDRVILRKTDGNTFEVALQYLSQADRDFVTAERAKPAAPPANAATGSSSSAFKDNGPTRKDILTDEQVAQLKTVLPGRKEGEQITFSVQLAHRFLTESEKRRLKESEVPFRITAELIESKVERNRTVSERLSGYVRFYLLDEEGNVLLSRREALGKMCPT